jgi:hypothetical protein
VQASERAAARNTRRRRTALAVLALLTALAVAAAGVASWQRAAAIRERDQAIYNQVIAEALQYGTSDTTLAAQLYLAAYRIQPAPDAASRLLNTEKTPLSLSLTGVTDVTISVAFSPDGTRWPAASPTAQSSCGMSPTPRTPARSARSQPTPRSVTRSALIRWRSALTGTRWLAEGPTARSGCGISPTPRTPSRSARL